MTTGTCGGNLLLYMQANWWVRCVHDATVMTPYLHMALRLHESSHDSKAAQKLARVGVGCHAWDDGVVGSFARRHHIGVGGVEDKIVPSVLE